MKPLLVVAVWWLWMPVLWFLFKGFVVLGHARCWHPPTSGSIRSAYRIGTRRDGGVWGLSPLAWLWIAIGLLGTAVLTLCVDDDGMSWSELGVIIASIY
jgi:hypothetical protein